MMLAIASWARASSSSFSPAVSSVHTWCATSSCAHRVLPQPGDSRDSSLAKELPEIAPTERSYTQSPSNVWVSMACACSGTGALVSINVVESTLTRASSQAAAEAVPGEMNCALIVQGTDDRTSVECNELSDPGRRVRSFPAALVAVVGERIHWVLCGEQRRQVAEGELATPQPSRHEHDGRVARNTVSHLHQSDSEAR
eukprot:scaffold4142_cov76-Phaeocystis_antarctica.AAC.1